MLADCKISNFLDLFGSSSFQIINSFVSNFFNNSSSNAAASFINSVICGSSGYAYNFERAQMINCIIFGKSNSIPSSSVGNNCVAVGFGNNNIFENSPSSTGCKSSTYDKIFKTFTGTYSDTETFELTDDAKTQFLGTDGTQIGMYGGVLPYTSTPSYPQITKMSVANKTTADGKLSVEIEVSAAK